MNLNKLLAMLKPKPKPRPIYVGDQIVGWDDGLPNSININRDSLASALVNASLDKCEFTTLLGVGYVKKYKGNLSTSKSYGDKGAYTEYGNCAGVTTGGSYLRVRDREPYWIEGVASFYWTEIAVAQSTSDHGLWKTVNGANTTLGREAVDLTADGITLIFLSAYGTTIKSGRLSTYVEWNGNVSYTGTPISVTDTSISAGAITWGAWWDRYGSFTTGVSYWPSGWTNMLGGAVRDEAAGSPPFAPPEPLAYFEVPVEEFHLPEVNDDSTVNLTTDFYGVKLPEEIAVLEKPVPEHIRRKREILERKGWSEEEIRAFLPEAFPVERINRLAVTWSALIPSDKSGKPIHGTAIVRVFGGSPEYVHPIDKRIQAIKEMRGVRQLSREEAIDLALKMDDKLHIHDLVPCTKHELGGKCFKEYRDWRIHMVGDKPEFADTDIRKHYVKEMKGW
jgi:hypothetical protein